MRRIAFALPLLAALTAALFAAAPASAANFIARTSASGTPGPSGEERYFASGRAPVQAHSEHQGSRLVPYDPIPPVAPFESHTLAYSQATALADMNGIHLRADARGLIEDAKPFNTPGFSASATASAGLGDSITIGAPGAVGMLHATAAFSVHALLSGVTQVAGSMDPAIPGNAAVYLSWTARLVVSGDNGILGDLTLSGGCNSFTNVNDGLFKCGGDPLGLHSTTSFSFASGETLSVGIEGEVRLMVIGAQERGGMASASSVADFGNTMAWGGFQDVRDSLGNPVTGFTALSASTGFNYANPFPSAIPEPSTWLLMLCGLAGLARLGQRRRCAG